MLKIAIVDDLREESIHLEELLRVELSRIGQSECEFEKFSSGEEFLSKFRKASYDLIVLDIYMDELTGIDVARRIRALGDNSSIAFFTSSNDYASESYELQAVYYLKKPVQAPAIRNLVDRLEIYKIKSNRSIELPDGRTFLLRQIIHTNYYQRYVTFITEDGNFRFRIAQHEAEALLQEHSGFISVGQSDIVNFDHVVSLTNGSFVMSNGDMVTIPRRFIKEAKDAYSTYRFNKAIEEH